MEGMALGPSPVRTLASLAAHRADAQKYTGPSTAEGKAARSFHGTKLPISLEAKGGGETNRGTKLTFRHGGEEENWVGKAPRGARLFYGSLGAGMTTFGTGKRREERQADPTAAATRCQAEARCAYDQSRNVVLFQGDRARDSTFNQGFRW
jgi:hypothetical protein